MTPAARDNLPILCVAVLCAVLLAVFTVHYQVTFMNHQGGLAWYERVQWERTCQVMHGEQGTPWQYRLFTDSIVYGTVRLFEAAGVPRPIGSVFLLIRITQNMLIMALGLAYFRRLGLSLRAAVFGIGLFAAGMCHGLYDTDMTFNTYTDISIFLLAGLIILEGRDNALFPLIFVAAFNRETSGCIPFMFLAARWGTRPRPWARFAVLLGIWAIIVGGMRLPFFFGMRAYIVPTAGKEPILPLLLYNLTWPRTWIFLFAVLSIVPALALLSWKNWPTTLRAFFWAVVPVWFPLHFALAHAPETRLFFVPQILVFIPGALLGLRRPPPPEPPQPPA